MNTVQRNVLRILIQAHAFVVGRARADIRGPGHPSIGPSGPRVIHLDALMVDPVARAQVLKVFTEELALRKSIKCVSSVPQGCGWFTNMAADRLDLPLLIPSQLAEAGAGVIQGFIPDVTPTWMIDADPDAVNDGCLLNAAEIISSARLGGCHVTGAAALFERDGKTRHEFLERFPRAEFFSLIPVLEALEELASGLCSDLVDGGQAAHLLRMMEVAPASLSTRTPRSVP